MASPSILVVDDRTDIILSAQFVLEDNGYQVQGVKSPYDAKQLLERESFNLILLDMNYSLDTTSGDEGLEFLVWLQKSEFDVATVAMTAWSNVELAVRAMQLGAGDFIEKPWKNQRLLQVIAQQLELSGLKSQNRKLSQRLEAKSKSKFEFEWASKPMTQLLSQVSQVAQADVNILLTGDNGTGKSQLAEFIHANSNRHAQPFISVNMGAISESLFESEMFGHKKGAFTDAKENRIGRFELAQGGSLFLDEIANIPLSQQAKLLRVLESGEYEVLGSSKTLTTDIRLISATNANIEKMVTQDTFREDLLYRFNTISFHLPPLSARQEDIVPLAEHFIRQFCQKYQRDDIRLSKSAAQALKAYPWPGNIREMSHLIERAVLLCQEGNLDSEALNLSRPSQPQTLPQITLEQAERQLIKQALVTADNNITQAANLLGLTKSSLYRRLEKYDDLQD